MALLQPFPQPVKLVQFAYRQLDLATRRQLYHLLPLHDLANLQRPWDPATCQTLQLRREVWSWLEAVVTWLNHDYIWDVADVIPPCWPQHPHLMHEIAVLASRCVDDTEHRRIARIDDFLVVALRHVDDAFADAGLSLYHSGIERTLDRHVRIGVQTSALDEDRMFRAADQPAGVAPDDRRADPGARSPTG